MKGFSNKVCTSCGVEQPLENYSYKDSKHTARRSTCKVCSVTRKQSSAYRLQQSENIKRKRKDDKEYYERSRTQVRQYRMTPKGRATALWHNASYRAKINKLRFELTLLRVEFALILGCCERTGIPFDLNPPAKGVNFNPYSPSIDKRDPFGNYTDANVQIVCNAYNLAKNQFTDHQFIEFCKIVVAKNG